MVTIRIAGASTLLIALASFAAVAAPAKGEHAQEPNPSLRMRAGGTELGSADFADPFVLRDRDQFFAFATNANGDNVQAAVASDLSRWRRLPDALPILPGWASKGATWAPAVLKRDAHYVLFYTARDRASGFQCISRAIAPKPEGPYVDRSERPFICQTRGAEALCGSIDPSPFVDQDGMAYLYWKSDENSPACRTAPRIWVQKLTDDGMSLNGTPHAILSMDQPWELPIVEGPSMVRERQEYFLFYSANWYASGAYAMGYAKCRSPSGPCQKVTTAGPWLGSHGHRLGPGGQEFFSDATGRLYMAFHAWSAPNTDYEHGGARSLHIEPLSFIESEPMIEQPIESIESR